jgi:muramidase (phage lysozyme)
LEDGILEIIKIKIDRLAKKLKYVNLIRDEHDHNEIGTFAWNIGEIFVEQVLLAKQHRAPIKNCYLCCYRGDNWYDFSTHGTFCKTYRRKCNSNDATECDRYRLQS